MLSINPNDSTQFSKRNINTNCHTWVLWKPVKELRGSCDERLAPKVPSACCRGQQCVVVLALSPTLDAAVNIYIRIDLTHHYLRMYKVGHTSYRQKKNIHISYLWVKVCPSAEVLSTPTNFHSVCVSGWAKQQQDAYSERYPFILPII